MGENPPRKNPGVFADPKSRIVSSSFSLRRAGGRGGASDFDLSFLFFGRVGWAGLFMKEARERKRKKKRVSFNLTWAVCGVQLEQERTLFNDLRRNIIRGTIF